MKKSLVGIHIFIQESPSLPGRSRILTDEMDFKTFLWNI